jgi:hypothetical protein
MFNRPDDVGKMVDSQTSIVANYAGGGLAGAAVKKIAAPIATNALGRIVAATAEGTGAGAGGGALDATVQGTDIGEGAKDGAIVGGALSGVASMAGEGVKAGQKLVRKIPWVDKYLSAKAAGTYVRPDMAEMPANESGVQKVVDRAQSSMMNRNAEKLSGAGSEYATETGAAKAAKPQQGADIAVQKLHELSGTNRSVRSGKIRDPELERAINETFDQLDIGPDGNVHIDDLLSARRTIQDRAEFGSPATKDNRPYRQIYKSLNDTIDNPRLRAADSKYSDQMKESERFTDIMTGTEESNISRGVREDGTPDIRAPKERTASNRLKRIGDDTVAGTTDARQLEEVRGMDPAYAEQLALIEAQKAKAATSFGAPQVQSSLPRLIGKLPGAPLVEQNARWLGSRVAAPVLDAAADVGQAAGPAITNPVVRGAIANRERERERGEKLKAAHGRKR